MILCYHCVTPRPDLISDDPWKMFLAADSFGKQLDFLQKNYNVISLEQYLEARRQNRPLPPFSVVLTFDDGKRNFLTVIEPSLKKLSMPATTFVVVENTEKAIYVNGSSNPYGWKPEDDHNDLSWDDIRRLMETGKIEIGSHSMTHPVLPEIPLSEAEYEMERAYRKIAAKTAHKRVALAYPHGQATEEIMKIAEDAGYSCALTNTDAGNDYKTNLFSLNRTIINADDDLYLFAARVAGITGRFNKIKNLLRPLKTKAKNSKQAKINLSQNYIKNIFF